MFSSDSIARKTQRLRVCAFMCNVVQRNRAYCAFEPSRRSERESDSSWRKKDSGGKTKLRRTRRKDERQADARGEKRSRGAPVLLYISRPSSGRQIDSVGSPLASRALARAYHVASHLFTLTQYLLGRIGESARSLIRAARQPISGPPSLFLARDDDGLASRFTRETSTLLWD